MRDLHKSSCALGAWLLVSALLVSPVVSAQPAPDAPAEPALGPDEPEAAEAGAAMPVAPVPAAEPAVHPPPPPAVEREAPAARPEAPDAGPQPAPSRRESEPPEPPWEKKPKIRARGHIHALYTLTDLPDTPLHQFSVRSARLELEWRHGDLLKAAVEGEFAQEDDRFYAPSILRDAYVRVAPLRELRIQMGQFKRPFSRLELRPRRRLRLIDRGLGNAWIIEELGYGDRDVGLQIEGRFGDQTGVEYAVGVFNGSGRNRDEADLDGSKDWVARIESDPTRWLSLGLNASYKWFDDEARPLYPRSALMGGADFLVRIGRLRVLGEGLYGENYLYVGGIRSWGALLLASYKVPLMSTWRLALEPLAKGEILMIQHNLRDGHALMGTAGANLHVGRYFRLMMQGELIRHGRRMPEPWEEESRLLVQAAMSTR